jgi:hypothetical protein
VNHVHVSAVTAITVFLMVILVGTFWRFAAMRLAETPIGKAMAFAY